MNIDAWVAGYKVRAFDWVDRKNIYMHIEYYKPGSSLSQPPAVEKSFLISREEEVKVRNYLHSVVVGLMEPRLTMADWPPAKTPSRVFAGCRCARLLVV